ncbi:MAG: carbon-nitrogen hydrolase family protein [Deinococcota bacterium]
MTITIASAQAQIYSTPWENAEAACQLIAAAKQAGADLVHFPEGAFSGYVKQQIKHWDDVDWDALEHALLHICTCAKDTGMWVVGGSNHRLTPPHWPHNSLLIIDSDGQLHTRYDKRFLSHTEVTNWYTPGSVPITFEVNGYTFGCAICIEVQFPEVFGEYRELGVDCVLLSSYSDSTMFGIQAQGHAACNNIWLSFSIPAQMSADCPSRIIGPSGELVAQCAPNQAEVTLYTLDRDDPRWDIPLHKARPWRQKARAGNIYQSKHVTDPRSQARNKL